MTTLVSSERSLVIMSSADKSIERISLEVLSKVLTLVGPVKAYSQVLGQGLQEHWRPSALPLGKRKDLTGYQEALGGRGVGRSVPGQDDLFPQNQWVISELSINYTAVILLSFLCAVWAQLHLSPSTLFIHLSSTFPVINLICQIFIDCLL